MILENAETRQAPRGTEALAQTLTNPAYKEPEVTASFDHLSDNRDNSVAELPLFSVRAQVEQCHYGAPTSARAAKRASIRAYSTAWRILQDLAAHGPSTPDEVARRIGKQPSQVRPRFTTPLIDNGWIAPTGLERRSTAFDGQAYVCAITDDGKRIIGEAA